MSNTHTQIFAQKTQNSSIKLTPTQSQKHPIEPQTSNSNSENSSNSVENPSLETCVPECFLQNNALSQSDIENGFTIPEVTKDTDIIERAQTTGKTRKILLELGLVSYPLDSYKIPDPSKPR